MNKFGPSDLNEHLHITNESAEKKTFKKNDHLVQITFNGNKKNKRPVNDYFNSKFNQDETKSFLNLIFFLLRDSILNIEI